MTTRDEFFDALELDNNPVVHTDCNEGVHDLFETTTVMDTERHYVCKQCGYKETEPMLLHVPRLNGGW